MIASMKSYTNLRTPNTAAIGKAKRKLKKSFDDRDEFFRQRCEELLQKLSQFSAFIKSRLDLLVKYSKSEDSDKVLIKQSLKKLQTDSKTILKGSQELVLDRYEQKMARVRDRITLARLNRQTQVANEFYNFLNILDLEKINFRERYVDNFADQVTTIENFRSQLQPEIIAEGAREENVQQNQLRRRRGRTPRARRARNNNIRQGVGQNVPSPNQTLFFTFFKIKRNRQQNNNMREPRLFDNKVDNDEEIVRKAVIVKEVDGGFKVGTIVYESMDQFQGDDVDKVRIYYLRVNGIKNIRKENLKTIRDNDSNIFVKLVERDAISPIPENFDSDWLKMFSCINYAPSGAVIGYIPGKYRVNMSVGLFALGSIFYLSISSKNEAELKKVNEELDRMSFLEFLRNPELDKRQASLEEKCKGLNIWTLLSREMIWALAISAPSPSIKILEKKLKQIFTTRDTDIKKAYGLAIYIKNLVTNKFILAIIGGTTLLTDVSTATSIYSISVLVEKIKDLGLEKVQSYISITFSNILRDFKRLIPLRYLIIYIAKKFTPNMIILEVLTTQDVSRFTTRAFLGFDMQTLAEILNYILYLEAMVCIYKLMCPLLLWQSGQLENCAYQPRKKEKSELYEDLKF